MVSFKHEAYIPFLWLSSQRANVQKPSHLRICGEPICIGNVECVSVFHRRKYSKLVEVFLLCCLLNPSHFYSWDTQDAWIVYQEEMVSCSIHWFYFHLSPSKLSCICLALPIKGVVPSFRLSSSRNYKWRWNKNSMWYNLCWVLAVGQRWPVSRIASHSLKEHQKHDCVEDQWEVPHLKYMQISLLSVDKDSEALSSCWYGKYQKHEGTPFKN